MYPFREAFFFELFSALKKLAESNIAYMDSHCGNIIPNRGQGLHLIDFDAATLEGVSIKNFERFCGSFELIFDSKL